MSFLATKVGMKIGDAPEDEGSSPAAVRKQLDKSLLRLSTDYIDIYYLHRPRPRCSSCGGYWVELMTSWKRGKVRYYGVSNYSAEQLRDLLKAADENNLPRPVVHQPPYSLLKREIEENLLPLCEQETIGVCTISDPPGRTAYR